MPQVGLLIFDQLYNSLTESYKKCMVSRDRVANLGQMYSKNYAESMILSCWEYDTLSGYVTAVAPKKSAIVNIAD